LSCTGLIALDLGRYKLTHATLYLIVEFCPAIQTLQVCGNWGLTDKDMLILSNGLPCLVSLTFLQPPPSGNLVPCHNSLLRFVESCPKVTFWTYQRIILLMLLYARLLTLVLDYLILNISCNSALTDISLFNLAENYKQLQKLDISNNGNLTFASIRNLAKNCKQMLTIESGNFILTTDAYPSSLLQIGKQLRKF
jgi:hypothetical protein